MPLEAAQVLHRRSFGHRNARTYLLVVYSPESQACCAVEQQVERLASGLRHEPSFVVAALNAATSPESGAFASSVLGLSHLPALLLYPEAAPGYLTYRAGDSSAEALLGAVNGARRRAMPSCEEFELIEAYTPLGLDLELSAAAAAAVGRGNGGGAAGAYQRALVQLPEAPPLAPDPLLPAAGYWSRGRAAFWGALVLLSLAAFAWDTGLGDAWDAWWLARRQAARRAGRRFESVTNTDDVMQLLMDRQQLAAAAAAAASGKDARLDATVQQRAAAAAARWGLSHDVSGRGAGSSSGGGDGDGGDAGAQQGGQGAVAQRQQGQQAWRAQGPVVDVWEQQARRQAPIVPPQNSGDTG